ncbi:MAG: hypothetical protein SAJ11_21850, partial [Jaaginema sp. PMC 1078.18]|nr:hypothetical protein [Jaaginema sp. PMC 1078.18]
MSPNKSPGRITRIRQRVQQRIVSSFQGRAGFLKSAAVQRIFLFVPTPMRRILPFAIQEFQPEIDGMTGVIGRQKGLSESQILAEIEAETALPVPVSPFSRSLNTAYACLENNPLNCPWSRQTTETNAEQQYCFKCGFPAILAAQKQIRGDFAVYQIESFQGDRGQGRFYQALQLPDRQPCILKEYLLPKKYYNETELQLKKANFKQLSSLDLADGRPLQDFRLLSPLEAIPDTYQERCYLIFKGDLYGVPTLRSYLQKTGAFSNLEVFQVLKQVLQSLQFLHTQKFRISGRLMAAGMAHGNINLDSLLIVPHFQGFFIYLTDLALWEDIFDLPLTSPVVHSPTEDLQALAYVAFYLLAGKPIALDNNSALQPEIDTNWP